LTFTIDDSNVCDRRDSQFAVIPFCLGEPIKVLLVAPNHQRGWRLAGGLARKGVSRHARAAVEARLQLGVTGRLYKRALKLGAPSPTLSVFPLLVRSETVITAKHTPLAVSWVPLQDAHGLVDQDLRQIIDAFAARVGSVDPLKGQRSTLTRGYARKSREATRLADELRSFPT
jgi:hypothetical protein